MDKDIEFQASGLDVVATNVATNAAHADITDASHRLQVGDIVKYTKGAAALITGL